MPEAGAIERVLVRAPNWIGDAVMCLPAIEALKSLYPDSEITVLTKTRAVPVFLNNPHVVDIMEYDDKERHRGLKGRFRLRAEIKKRGFGLAVLFQNAFDAAFVSYISGIPERAGYARDFRSRLLTKPVPLTDEIKKRHQVFYYLNIIKALGGTVPSDPAPRLYLSKEEVSWADGFISENGLAGAFLSGAAPGASYGPAKRWAPEGFAEVLNRFNNERGAASLIFGGPEDAPSCAEVSGKVRGKVIDLSGRITLRQAMALLKRLDIFITNDSGPMHIAAALGVPTVAVFGSTDARLTGPVGPHAKAVSNKAECSPCFERTCGLGHYKCFDIGSAEVFEAAKSLLKGYKSGEIKS